MASESELLPRRQKVILSLEWFLYTECVCSVMSDSLQPMDCSLLGSSVHGIFQTRILEWVAMSSCRGPSSPGITPVFPASSTLQVDSLPLGHQRGPYPWNNEGETPVTRRSVPTSNRSEEEKNWMWVELSVAWPAPACSSRDYPDWILSFWPSCLNQSSLISLLSCTIS